jgi:HEAT repeat protein
MLKQIVGPEYLLWDDAGDTSSADALIAALKDSAPRVKFFAAQSLGKLNHAAAAPALIAALRANNDQDEYLRHALVLGLVGGHNVTALTAAMASDSRAVRLGLVLTFRRLQNPTIAKFLNTKLADRIEGAGHVRLA